jgi:hypothetical protein
VPLSRRNASAGDGWGRSRVQRSVADWLHAKLRLDETPRSARLFARDRFSSQEPRDGGHWTGAIAVRFPLMGSSP